MVELSARVTWPLLSILNSAASVPLSLKLKVVFASSSLAGAPKATGLFSSHVISWVSSANTGASLTSVTLTVILCVVELVPSLAVTVAV